MTSDVKRPFCACCGFNCKSVLGTVSRPGKSIGNWCERCWLQKRKTLQCHGYSIAPIISRLQVMTT